MVPKLNEDTYYIPVPEGIYLRNSRGSHVIKGTTVYQWVERLTPYLDGSHTLAELTHGMRAERVQMVSQIVENLMAQGYLRDVALDEPHTLTPEELSTYAAEIAFVDANRGSGAAHFQRFRASKLLVLGSGQLVTAAARAALRCGIRHVTVGITHEGTTNLDRLREHVALAQQRDPAQTLTELALPDLDDPAALRSAIEPYDAIIHVCDLPMLARTRLLNEACVAQQKVLLPAVVVEDVAWVGPFVAPESHGCWECAWRRLQANLDDVRVRLPQYAVADHAEVQASPFLALPTAALTAGQLVFELMKYVSGAGQLQTQERMVAIDLETAETRQHAFLPHPLCASCHASQTSDASPLSAPPTSSEFSASLGRLRDGAALDPDTFSEQAVTRIDARLGILTALDEGDLIQRPLAVATATLSNPALLEWPMQSRVIAAVDARFRGARRRAAQRGLELCAASSVDPHRLLTHADAKRACADGFAPIPAERIRVAVPVNVPAVWTWAAGLPNGEPHLVPAACVFPSLAGIPPRGEAALGVGSGMSWSEAVARALLSWLEHLTVARIPSALTPFARVDLDAIDLESESQRQRQLLDMATELLTVYDVTGPLGLPTVAVCLDYTVVAYAAHPDVAHALRDGFERALAFYQFRRVRDESVPGVSDTAPLDIPPELRSQEFVVPRSVAADDWVACEQWLSEAACRSGWLPLAVPLDHDPALREVLPYVVRVLLADRDVTAHDASSLA